MTRCVENLEGQAFLCDECLTVFQIMINGVVFATHSDTKLTRLILKAIKELLIILMQTYFGIHLPCQFAAGRDMIDVSMREEQMGDGEFLILQKGQDVWGVISRINHGRLSGFVICQNDAITLKRPHL